MTEGRRAAATSFIGNRQGQLRYDDRLELAARLAATFVSFMAHRPSVRRRWNEQYVYWMGRPDIQDGAHAATRASPSAEVLRVLTACDAASRQHYPSTLFAAGEAYAGACTAKTTIFCANIAAGMMVAQFAKYLRNLPIDADVQPSLLSSELTVSP